MVGRLLHMTSKIRPVLSTFRPTEKRGFPLASRRSHDRRGDVLSLASAKSYDVAYNDSLQRPFKKSTRRKQSRIRIGRMDYTGFRHIIARGSAGQSTRPWERLQLPATRYTWTDPCAAGYPKVFRAHIFHPPGHDPRRALKLQKKDRTESFPEWCTTGVRRYSRCRR